MELFRRDDWRELKAHPAAEMVRRLTDAELTPWVEGLIEHGYREQYPVILKGDLILDGRNRLRACELAGVEPWFQEYEGDDLIAFIVAANFDRRQLTKSQAAIAAVEILPLYQAEAKERQRRSGGDRKSKAAKSVPVNLPEPIGGRKKAVPEAATQVGRLFGCGTSYVQRANLIVREAPDLVPAVRDGARTLHTAWREMKTRDQREKMSVSAPLTEKELKNQRRREKRQKASKEERTTQPVAEGAVPLCQTNRYGTIGTYDEKAARRIAVVVADPVEAARTLANHFDRGGMEMLFLYLLRYLDPHTVAYVLKTYGKERDNERVDLRLHAAN